jgi:hypothetical protein
VKVSSRSGSKSTATLFFNMLRVKNLEINKAASDGNCMFYAVSDQLMSQLAIDKPFKELRELTSKLTLENADEFQPYMCS